MRLVAVEDVGDQTRAAREVQEFVGEADQATGRDAVFQAHAATAVGFHVHQLALALAQRLHHATLVAFLDVGRHQLDRLAALAVDILEHHARLGDGQLVAFAAHFFEQDGQVQFATAGHFEDAILVGFLHAQRHIGAQFLLQAVPDLAAGHELAFAAGQRRGVHAEVHGQRGLVDLQHGQRRGAGGIGDGLADAHVLDAVDQHDLAGAGFGHLHTIQTLEHMDLVDATAIALAVGAGHHQHVLASLQRTLRDTADTDTADEGGVVERRHLHLQRSLGVALHGGHVVQNGVEQGRHIAAPLLAGRALFLGRPAVDARSVDHREVQLFIGGAELVEQVEGCIDHIVRTGTRLVHLVDHHDGLEAQGQGLLGHETRLGHGAFLRIDQQHHAVDHGQRALHLAAEVRVAGRVEDVDVRVLPAHGAVLGQDGDAALALDGVVVHHGVHDLLVGGEGAGLTQQLVHHGGLAVVDVRDDGDVSDLFTHDVSKMPLADGRGVPSKIC